MSDLADRHADSTPRLLLADDDVFVLATLRAQLEPHFSVVAVAEDADGAVELAGEQQPDVALVDVEMPGGGLLATRGIRDVSPDTAIVILTSDDSRSSVLQFLEFGATAYLRKGLPAELIGTRLLEAVAAHRALVTRVGRQRQAAEDRFHAAFEQAAVGMAIIALEGPQAGMLVVANRAYAGMIGREVTELAGSNPEQWTHPDDLPDGVSDPLAVLAREDVERVEFEQRYLHSDGRVISVMGTAASFVDEDGRRVAIIQVPDISERKRVEGELEYLAEHDSLTGLFNRRRFAEELDRELVRAQRYGGRGALLVVDLDGFKAVNDSLGHSAGDELVTTLADTMRRALRDSDIVGRAGGDEFAVLLPEADLDAALLVSEKLRVAIRRQGTISRGDRHARVTTSIGVVVFEPGDDFTGEDLMIKADLAMYDAKRAGKDRVCVYRRGEPREQIAVAQSWRSSVTPSAST